MTTHEVAKRLLEMSDEELFIKDENGNTYHIESVEMCSCGAEAWINVRNETEFYNKEV